MDELEIIKTTSAPASVGPFSQGTRARGFIFCSGQGAFDPVTGNLVPGGIKEQTRRVLRNIEAVLKAGGSDLGRGQGHGLSVRLEVLQGDERGLRGVFQFGARTSAVNGSR